jgi:hypothetical protein
MDIEKNIENIDNPVQATQSATKATEINATHAFYYSIFNRSGITFIIWLLAMHFSCVFMYWIYLNRNVNPTPGNNASRILDFGVFFLFLMYLTTSYYSYSEAHKEKMIESGINGLASFADTPSSIFTLGALIIIVYFTIYLFGVPMNPENKPFVVASVENFAWFLLVFIAIVDFFKYVLGLSFIKMLRDYFSWSSLPVDAPGSILSTLKYDVSTSADDLVYITKTIGEQLDIRPKDPHTTLSPGPTSH